MKLLEDVSLGNYGYIRGENGIKIDGCVMVSTDTLGLFQWSMTMIQKAKVLYQRAPDAPHCLTDPQDPGKYEPWFILEKPVVSKADNDNDQHRL